MTTTTKTFRASLLLGVMLAGVSLAGPAAAWSADDGGKQAGAFMVRARLIDVIPQTSSSSISVIGGNVDVTSTLAPEVDFSYFFTDNIAAELIAATTRHTLSASNTAIGPVQVGTTWVLPPALTLQYHFMPKETFSPYVGAGINYTFFYDSKGPGSGSPITRVSMQNNPGAVIQAGIDWNINGRLYANIDVKQIFVNTQASLNSGAIVAKTALNPTVVGVGMGWRF
jgi:outer membrane protein